MTAIDPIKYIRTDRSDGTFYIKPDHAPFKTLDDAGAQLGEKLIATYGTELQNAIIFGCVRGGLPVAMQVAEKIAQYNPIFDAVVIRKFNLPEKALNIANFSIGAVTQTGDVIYRTAVASKFSLDLNSPEIKPHLDEQIEKEGAEVKRRTQLYRGDRKTPQVGGRTVIIVDDGMANGTTAQAALRSILALAGEQKPRRIIIAVPVCSEWNIRFLTREEKLEATDICSIVCVKVETKEFWNSDDFYEVIRDVDDKEVCDIMNKMAPLTMS